MTDSISTTSLQSLQGDESICNYLYSYSVASYILFFISYFTAGKFQLTTSGQSDYTIKI